MTVALPKTRSEWQEALDSLPDASQNGGRIPAFFFAHGHPMLVWPRSIGISGPMSELWKASGPESPLAQFLHDFGRTLLQKYKPRGILVFSAHWETSGERVVTDYGDENPLLMDYYGFHDELYKLKFKSRGDSSLTARIVEAFKKAGYRARSTPRNEARGEDGRGFAGPGLDHGVFVPFIHMFGKEFTDVPIVQASIDGRLDPESEWAVGKAVEQLRSEGILILSGGLTVHNLRDRACMVEGTAQPAYFSFEKAIEEAVQIESPEERKKAMANLTSHPAFRLAHPRAEHFVPLYIAAGAAEQGKTKVISARYGAKTVAFGL